MENVYYIGLDVHKKTISYCVKDGSGRIHAEGKIPATRFDLDGWMKTLPQPWTVAMEATIFTGWIYDHLRPHAAAVKVAHPLMLRAIAAAKKKNDRIDAKKIADGLRCNFLPECYMAPTAIRERRRTLRYRNLLVRQTVQLKNRISGLLDQRDNSHVASFGIEATLQVRPLLRLGDQCARTVRRIRLGHAIQQRSQKSFLAGQKGRCASDGGVPPQRG